jgi:hypothetical protein
VKGTETHWKFNYRLATRRKSQFPRTSDPKLRGSFIRRGSANLWEKDYRRVSPQSGDEYVPSRIPNESRDIRAEGGSGGSGSSVATRATSSSPVRVRLTFVDFAKRRSLVGVDVLVGAGVGDSSFAGVVVLRRRELKEPLPGGLNQLLCCARGARDSTAAPRQEH